MFIKYDFVHQKKNPSLSMVVLSQEGDLVTCRNGKKIETFKFEELELDILVAGGVGMPNDDFDPYFSC
ncbi:MULTISPECIES: hypothetical protein [Vibrio]|uniref:hypothetical protein n=1 Tax=Vibrio TaxID=662 RepID=UPI0002B95C83|nr:MULTISPECIES: hypothetical protein [Vibrio]EGR0659773.1 hypothetical protein [Vibrio cholerae]EGR5155397.1 hypothetical protein [Vibrio cholerae]EIC9845398.1 hypothetical protein [Vibrio cholerae]EJL6275405.1 hypothetical protein [Vibrio cholerae]EJL6300344.1 hypothetical protein [Vibrio cholerae]